MSGCTLSLEELENDRDFDKKKPRGLVCYKRDNWKTSVHFVSEEAYAFQAATEPLLDICCKDCLDSRIYEVYDEILWKESEKADSLYDTQDVMDYEKSWKEVSEESACPDHGGLVYPLEGKSLEDRVEDLGDQHPDRAALVQEDRLDIRIASVEAFKRLTKRLVKFAPYLLDFESEAEALGRIQDGFKNPPKVDEKEADENTNVQIGDEEIAEEHKREQSRQAVQRAGLFKTEDSEIKVGSIPMDTKEESSPEPTETEEVKRDPLDHKHSKLEPIGKLWLYGQDTGGIKWRQGSFYLMKPNQKSVADDTLDDLYLLKIVGKLPSKEERTLGITPVMKLWRSEEAVEKPKERTYLPVYVDSKGKEIWDRTIKEDDEDFTPWTIQESPRLVLNAPFDLTPDMQIPERIWDILLDSDFPFEYIGAPPYDKVTRGKKCRKLKPEKEADNESSSAVIARILAFRGCLR
eukprot:g3307.t1